MAELCRLDQLRRPACPTFFDRTELNQLLSLYSRHVACGVWRDYAIDQRAGSAVFSVFRHSQDAPVFRIAKRVKAPGSKGEFLVLSGRQTLKQAASLHEALSVFRRPLRVVS